MQVGVTSGPPCAKISREGFVLHKLRLKSVSETTTSYKYDNNNLKPNKAHKLYLPA